MNCEKDFWLDGEWYAQLLDEIVPNRPDDLKDGMLSVITFNYDRSFEYFFTTAFEAGFRLNAEEAFAMFDRVNVIHVYGQLGPIRSVPYGNSTFIRRAASGISFMRDAQKADCRTQINQTVQNAETVCFIGFAFSPENVALFDPNTFDKKSVIGTAMGLSPNRIADAKKYIRHIKFFDGSAADLLQSQNIFGRQKTPSRKDLLRLPGANRRFDYSLGTGREA